MIKLTNNESSVYCSNSTEKECDKCLFTDECKDRTIKIKREKILSLQSGDELDALVISTLFEEKPERDFRNVRQSRDSGGLSYSSPEGYWIAEYAYGNNNELPEWKPGDSPSECIWVAWDWVIEKMTELGYTWNISRNKDDDITCCFGKYCVTTSSASESICKAAVLAKLT